MNVLNMQGTARSDRHASRSQEPQSGGKPQRPAWLKGEALKFWNHAVPKLDRMGILQSIDSAELAAMCRWWAEWRRTDRELEDEVDDKERFKLTILAGMSWKRFEALAIKFGLTPVDRIRLAKPETAKQESPLSKLLKSRQALN